MPEKVRDNMATITETGQVVASMAPARYLWLGKRIMKPLRFTLSAIFLCLLIEQGWAATYCVDPTGNNTNSGISPNCWPTVQKAANTAVAGDTVNINAGTYHERVVMQNSGTNGAPITFQGASNTTTIIDGSDAISGTWTSEGNGIYSIPLSSIGYEPWSLYDNGRVIWKIADQYFTGCGGSGCHTFTDPGLNGLGTLGISTSTSVTDGSTTALFWDGIEAYFGTDGTKVYVRYRDGSNPATKNLRSAPGPTCRGCNPNPAATLLIGDKSYISIRNMQIGGGHYELVIAGSTGAVGNVIDGNNIYGGAYRLYIIGNVSATVVKNNNFEMKAVGTEIFGSTLWRSFDPATPSASAANIHLYYQNKHTVGETDGYDADIFIWSGGGTGPADTDIGPNNTFYRGGAGVEFAGGDVRTKVHNNNIRWHFGQNIYLVGNSPNLEIYNNLITEGGQYNIRFDNGTSFSGPYYVYRNKFWRPFDSGHNFATFSASSDFNPTVWFYHNSISGGNECLTAVNGTLQQYHIINNVLSCIRLYDSSFQLQDFQYNWVPNAGLDGNTPVAGDYSGIGTGHQTGARLWTNGTLPNFVLPTGSSAIDHGIDLSQSPFSLPGMPSGYFSGAGPDMGAIETGASSSLPGGLIDHWKFDEGSGTTAADSVGSITGTLSGTQWVTPGHVGASALSFNGSSAYVQLASLPTSTGDLTVTFWMKLSSLAVNQVAIYFPTAMPDSTDGMVIGFYRVNNSLLTTARAHSATYGKESTANSIAANTWYHIAVTKTAGQIQKIYINAVDSTTASTTGDGNSWGISQGFAMIGADDTGPGVDPTGSFWNGQLDDVRLYDHQLSAQEIANIFNGVTPSPLPLPASPSGLTVSPGLGF